MMWKRIIQLIGALLVFVVLVLALSSIPDTESKSISARLARVWFDVKPGCVIPDEVTLVYYYYQPSPKLERQASCDLAKAVKKLKDLGYTEWPKETKIYVSSDLDALADLSYGLDDRTSRDDWRKAWPWIRGATFNASGSAIILINSGDGWGDPSVSWMWPSIVSRRNTFIHELTHAIQMEESCYSPFLGQEFDALTMTLAETEARLSQVQLDGGYTWVEIQAENTYFMYSPEFSLEQTPVEREENLWELLQSWGTGDVERRVSYKLYQAFGWYLLNESPGGRSDGRSVFMNFFKLLCQEDSNTAFTTAFGWTFDETKFQMRLYLDE